MKPTYIYCIDNVDNNPYKVYIGKTTNFIPRKYKHIQTYGKNININIIDKVENNWKFWEKYWIEQFKCWGYELLNKNKGGGGPEYRDPKSLQVIVSKLKKKIQQFDKDFNLIKEWSSVKEAKQQVGGNIDSCLNGKSKTAAGYYWKYSNIDFFKFDTSPKRGKKVLQYDLSGNPINMYNSTQEAERIFNTSGKDNIGACCRGKQKTAYGYIWKYK